MIGHMYRYLNEKKMAHWYFLRTPRVGSSLYLVRSLLVRSASLSTLWFRSKLPKMTENDENFKKGRGWQKFPRWKFFKFSKEFNGIFSFIIDPFIFEKKWCQWGGDIPAGRVSPRKSEQKNEMTIERYHNKQAQIQITSKDVWYLEKIPNH